MKAEMKAENKEVKDEINEVKEEINTKFNKIESMFEQLLTNHEYWTESILLRVKQLSFNRII